MVQCISTMNIIKHVEKKKKLTKVTVLVIRDDVTQFDLVLDCSQSPIFLCDFRDSCFD